MVGKSKHKMLFHEEQQRHSMYVSSSPSKQEGNLSQSQASVSMSALREAFEATDLRGHGSPVMALKETIDNHFNGTVSSVNMPSTSGMDSTDGENYLYPVVTTDPHPEEEEEEEGEEEGEEDEVPEVSICPKVASLEESS